jgi:hypothetical protein
MTASGKNNIFGTKSENYTGDASINFSSSFAAGMAANLLMSNEKKLNVW